MAKAVVPAAVWVAATGKGPEAAQAVSLGSTPGSALSPKHGIGRRWRVDECNCQIVLREMCENKHMR